MRSQFREGDTRIGDFLLAHPSRKSTLPLATLRHIAEVYIARSSIAPRKVLQCHRVF